MAKYRFAPVVLACLLFGGGTAFGQLTTGTITGSVTDQSGAAVPGADVTVKNVETGTSRTTVTGPRGRYEFPNLPPGQYEVSAVAAGFQTSVRSGIQLTVGRTAVVDHALVVGEVTQAVTVTGEAPLIETTTATVAQLVDERTVEDLPLNNRDLTQLTFLQPGVLKVPSSGDQGTFSGMGDRLTVAGARQTQNLFLLDGVSNTDLSNNPQGVSGSYTGAETVKEFQIITNNYSAEYQSAAGGIVSAVTKSGTNTLHGSGFWTLRNDNLDANRWENNRLDFGKREFKRNQFGGSLGGPIMPDKTFFFGSYEGWRERSNAPDDIRVFTADARAGIGVGLRAGEVVNPDIKRYLELWPVPNQPYSFTGETYPLVRDLGDGTALIAGGEASPINEDFVGAKFDHHMANEKAGILTGSYNYSESDRLPASVLNEVGGGDRGLTSLKHTLGAKHVSVLSPSMVNEFNFGYSFSDISNDLPITTQDFSNLAHHPARDLIGQINAPLVTGIGWRTNSSTFSQKAYQVKDGISITSGDHSFRMGTEIKWFRFKQDSCSRGCNGIFTWNSDLRRFLLNQPRRIEAFRPGRDNPIRDLKQLLFGAYFQDNWQVIPSLTLNLGLRYEFNTVPKYIGTNLIATLLHDDDPFVTVSQDVKDDPRYSGDTFMPGTIDSMYENPTLKSFSPRIGFAWAPGARRFSMRGGFGIFYDYPSLFNIRTVLQESVPFVQTGRLDASAVPSGRPALTMRPGVVAEYEDLLASQPGIRFFEHNQKNTTIYRWSLTLQQELGAGWVTSAGYTGSRGKHLWNQHIAGICKWVGFPENTRAKQWLPSFDSRGRLTNCLDDNSIHSGFSQEVRVQSPNVSSWFDGLAVGVQKRLSRGFQLQMAYNLSKALDQGSGVTSGGEELAEGQRGIYYYDVWMKKGRAGFDLRNTFTSNFTYELPTQNLAGLAGLIAGGWQFTGILTFYDGPAITLRDSNDDQEDYIGDNQDVRLNLIPGGDNDPVLDARDPFRYYDLSQFVPSTCRGGSYCYDPDGAPRPDLGYAPGFFGNVGRGTLTAPGNATVDFSVQKSFNVSENHRIQFRGELFNLFNRANFAPPESTPYLGDGTLDSLLLDPAVGGQIRSTRGFPRTIQFGLKYTF